MNFLSMFKKPKIDDIFEIFPDGIIVVSMDGKILDVNQKALNILGFSKQELFGSYFSQYIQGGSVLLNKLVQSGSSSVTRAAAYNNEDIFVEVSASKSENSNRVYVSVRDITKNYKLQNLINNEYEIAKKIIDEKNTYLKGISTDIFSLLTSVVNFSKALNDGVAGPLADKGAKYAAIISKNSSELQYDLQRLFKYFEVESGLYPYEYKRFDLADLLGAIAKEYENAFLRKKLPFSYDFSSFTTRSANLPSTAVDAFIRSLLDISLRTTDIGSVSFNAGNPPAEFLESKGIDASDENSKKYVMLEIKDSGLILPALVLENIFNPYYLDETATKKITGIKMSFAFVYRHVKNLKGDMWVYSKSGRGTLTCILLPMEKS